MALTSISPLDGRYAAQVQSLAPYFSEQALIYYRVRVELALPPPAVPVQTVPRVPPGCRPRRRARAARKSPGCGGAGGAA